MNNNRRDDRGGRGGGSSSSSRNEGNDDTRWVLAGVAWPFKNDKEGFNIDVDWSIRQGARLSLMPPKEEGRPWNLYELREKKRDTQR